MTYLKVFVFLVFVSGAVMSCGGSSNTEPFVDMDIYTDESGNVFIADTPRMWEDFVIRTRERIKQNINNERPPGVDSWNEHWVVSLESIKNGQQNPDKYIEYIINERRKAGLPEINN